MTKFLRSEGFEAGTYSEVIGLRHDEGIRLFKMMERNETDGRKCIAPLAKAKVTESDVMKFWSAQPFDLGLRPGDGNCDLCFLKSRRLRKSIIRRRPESPAWWIEQEESTGGFFDRRDLYSELEYEVRRQPELWSPDEELEHDAECGLLCQS